MSEIIVLGIYNKSGHQLGTLIQHTLSKYGNVIKTRLGLNDLEDNGESFGGLILLELMGDQHECDRLENELLSIDDLELKKMSFTR